MIEEWWDLLCLLTDIIIIYYLLVESKVEFNWAIQFPKIIN